MATPDFEDEQQGWHTPFFMNTLIFQRRNHFSNMRPTIVSYP
jgi:hypothetical protein